MVNQFFIIFKWRSDYFFLQMNKVKMSDFSKEDMVFSLYFVFSNCEV